MLLNVSIFAWYGAVAPWYLFAHNSTIPIYRLIFLAVLVLLFRRLPMVFAFRTKVWQIEDWRQASFTGFFGPIGVSAIFYLYTTLDFLEKIRVEGEIREDAQRLEEAMTIVVWFMVISSIVRIEINSDLVIMLTNLQIVHGMSVPVGKLGFHLPRTVSRAIKDRDDGNLSPPAPAPPVELKDNV